MMTPIARLALVLGLGVLPLAAQPGGNTHKVPAMAHLAEQLKLTDDQKIQLQAIQARHAEASKEKAQAAAEARKAFRAAAENPATPPAQLKSLYQAKADRSFDLLLDRRVRQSEIRAILTPDQLREWDKLQAYHKGLKQGRRGHGKRS